MNSPNILQIATLDLKENCDDLDCEYTGWALFDWCTAYPDEMRQYDSTICLVIGPSKRMSKYRLTSVLFCDGTIHNAVHITSLRTYKE